MGELSIKIKIAEREYPMRIDAGEEERLRQASRLINEQISQYRDQYGATDKQDLLAMVAFDAFVQKLEHEKIRQDTINVITERLSKLNRHVAAGGGSAGAKGSPPVDPLLVNRRPVASLGFLST